MQLPVQLHISKQHDLGLYNMTENQYQAKLIKRIYDRFPGCVVVKTDTGYQQGMPDLLVLHRRHWAALEVKASRRAPTQANQGYYIERLGEMSFSAFINPENEEEVLSALQQAFKSPRRTRVS
jgi:hypothetical protein